jgi:hypothetical protein
VHSRVVEASAPAWVGLAGGARSGSGREAPAAGVSVAVDRRAWCRVETGTDGVEMESKDRLVKVRGATVAEVVAGGRLTLAARVLQRLGVEAGVRVTMQSRVPDGAGLGEAASLATALAAAACAALGRELPADEVGALTPEGWITPGGGVLWAGAGRDGEGVEPLPVDPARIEECLLLVDAGEAPAAPRGAATAEAAAALSALAARVRDLLVAGRFDQVAAPVIEEWETRRRCSPGWPGARVERLAEVVRGAGGAARACEGRVVAVWAPPGERGPGPREAVLEAVKAAGFRLFPARVDLRGVDVEVEPGA